MSLPYDGTLIKTAKSLRKNMTPQEKHLWYDFLKDYPVRFQRQKVIKSFIADFYCHEAKLIVEVDGSQHYTEQGLAYDEERSGLLKEFDLTVIRFSNYDVNTKFEGVCTKIDETVKNQLSLK